MKFGAASHLLQHAGRRSRARSSKATSSTTVRARSASARRLAVEKSKVKIVDKSTSTTSNSQTVDKMTVDEVTSDISEAAEKSSLASTRFSSKKSSSSRSGRRTSVYEPGSLSKGSIFSPRRWTTVFDDEKKPPPATAEPPSTTVSYGNASSTTAASTGKITSINRKTVERSKSLKTNCGAQLYGQLWKKIERKGRLTRYVRRFFVVKESFLLYFAPAATQKPVVKKWQLNVHPKGVICLGGCTITPLDGVSEHRCGLMITSADFTQHITLATDTELDRQKWLVGLREASKITYKNAQLGESMIRELEGQAMRLHREKQEYVDRLQTEAGALRNEIDKCEELEKLKAELELEKEKLESKTRELQKDLENIKRELDLTNMSKRTLEEEKLSLNDKTEHLRKLLESLESEKLKTESALQKTEHERYKYKQENTSLNQMSDQLKRRLDDIQQQQHSIMNQKCSVESRLRENVELTKQLEAEKEFYSRQANELSATMNDLSTQKQKTELELREEAQARMLAEKQLCAAEKALEHLEKAMRLSGTQMAELKEQILPDVCQLKEFFEEIAYDKRLDADRHNIMRNAVTARKSLRRHRNKLRSSLRKADLAQRRLSQIGSEVDINNGKMMAATGGVELL